LTTVPLVTPSTSRCWAERVALTNGPPLTHSALPLETKALYDAPPKNQLDAADGRAMSPRHAIDVLLAAGNVREDAEHPRGPR
jgi:hypothetical protein